MKNKVFKIVSLLALPLMTLTGCYEEVVDEEQYQKEVYIVGAIDMVQTVEIKYSEEIQDTYIPVAVGGTRPTDRDITVTMTEQDEAIDYYNEKYIAESKTKYQKLESSLYSIPSPTVVLPTGATYARFPVQVKTAELDCDLLYALTFKIASVSEYAINKSDSVLILSFKLTNDYSGSYQMDATKTEQVAGAKGTTLNMVRELTAINQNTVRIFNQTAEEEANRANSCFTIKVNSDNSLTIEKWANSTISQGGGTYDPETKVYEFWYDYTENGKVFKVEGTLTYIPAVV